MSLRDEMKLAQCKQDLLIVQFALYYLLLSRKRELTQEDSTDFALKIMKSSLQPDLINERSNYQAGVLDYVALMTTAYFVDYAIALGILHYGENTYVKVSPSHKLRYFYNNINPGTAYDAVDANGKLPKVNWKAWLGQYPSVIAHFEFAAWKKPPLWRRLFWAARVISASYGTEQHQERNLIAWLMAETAIGKSRIINFAIWIWSRKFKRQYPQGIQYLVSSLFGANHPLAKYWSN